MTASSGNLEHRHGWVWNNTEIRDVFEFWKRKAYYYVWAYARIDCLEYSHSCIGLGGNSHSERQSSRKVYSRIHAKHKNYTLIEEQESEQFIMSGISIERRIREWKNEKVGDNTWSKRNTSTKIARDGATPPDPFGKSFGKGYGMRPSYASKSSSGKP